MATLATYAPHSPTSSSLRGDMSSPESPSKSQFALAQIKGGVHLVQVPDSRSALMVSDVHIFRHEFITIFRYSHRATVHPADLHILEPIEDRSALYEEDKGTVFLSRDVMARMQKLTMDAQRALALPIRHARHVSRIH